MDPAVIHRMVAAFTACVARVGANIEPPSYVINDSDVFESVVRLCFTHLGKSLLALIGSAETEVGVEDSDAKLNNVGKQKKKRNRCWKKHGNLIRSYLHMLLQVSRSCYSYSVG